MLASQLLIRQIICLQFSRNPVFELDYIRIFARSYHTRFSLFEKRRCEAGRLFKIADQKLVFLGKKVHSKYSVYIGRRCQHGFPFCELRDLPRPLIGAAQMPGQDRDHILSLFVNDDHCRIRLLAANVRRDRADRDPAGTDIDQDISFSKMFRRPLFAAALAGRVCDVLYPSQFTSQLRCQN